ncbi:hypothetical protein EUGRSUZ_L01258 [Eucalyptus grandis]|uniref:Uncharacterized protein n=1 Tax=Eucalyptus grandis TaxID=71139 RepID=A0A058ZTL4_EUCGR|nr:hypothetical protein EUGRSUZ_L01258 [Eucalyptus grandis]
MYIMELDIKLSKSLASHRLVVRASIGITSIVNGTVTVAKGRRRYVPNGASGLSPPSFLRSELPKPLNLEAPLDRSSPTPLDEECHEW